MTSPLTENPMLFLPLSLQVALAAGYLGYAVAYAGYRRAHQPVDSAFLSLIFGVPALLILQGSGALGIVVATGLGFAVSLLLGALWRIVGHRAWLWIMADLGVHQDDGTATAWDALIQRPGLKVEQCSVRTKDGRTLFMNSREGYMDLPNKGLVLGGSGDIVMVVEEERTPGNPVDRQAQGIVTENGVRLTYIPASEVAQVNLRVL